MIKFLCEVVPLIAFLIGYKVGGIDTATLYILISSVISVAIYYIVYRNVQTVALVSVIILVISAGLTLMTGNSAFIKMKPTIVYIVFAIGCIGTGVVNRPVLKYVLGHAIVLKDDKCWVDLGYRFGAFFALMAILNEFVWRHFSEELWVKFKVFGALPLLLIFIALHIPFFMRNQIHKD